MRKILGFIFRDFQWKLLSLALAFLIWLWAVNAIDPLQNESYSRNLRLINEGCYEAWSRQILEVGGLLGGWLKKTRDNVEAAQAHAPKSGGLQPGEEMLFTQEHEDVFKKGHLHGIEIFNGASYYPVVSQWCEERNLAMIANSDIHPSEWNQYGYQSPLRPMTLIFAKDISQKSVVKYAVCRISFSEEKTSPFFKRASISRKGFSPIP